MPFTPAHTVAVLPFLRSKRLSGSALVMGSMSPDFEYFVRINVHSSWGHDLLGIVLFDIPITIAAVILFHSVVKDGLLDNLPAFLQRRFAHLRSTNLKQDVYSRLLTFIGCAGIGALTHLAWDGFTHNGGFFVKALPSIYQGRSVLIDGANYPFWYVLQYASTAVGLLILIIYVLLMKPSTHEVCRPQPGYWIALIGIAAATVLIRFQFPYSKGLPMLVIATISGLFIGVIILGTVRKLRSKPSTI